MAGRASRIDTLMLRLNNIHAWGHAALAEFRRQLSQRGHKLRETREYPGADGGHKF